MFGKAVVASALVFVVSSAAPAWAQTGDTPLDPGGSEAWFTLGFQGDLGGTLNSSGVGVVNGMRAELDSNTWGERYNAAFIFRFGGGYNLNGHSQIFGSFNLEQAKADTAVAGLIGGQPLSVSFRDYKGWGLEGGYRYFFNTPYVARPFATASLGFQRINNIGVDFTSAPVNFQALNVPFYDESFVVSWRLGGGVEWDIKPRFGIVATAEIKYSGKLSDESGIGTLGFERVNDTGNRMTLPIMGGVYYKF
jgi:hypothetical protein